MDQGKYASAIKHYIYANQMDCVEEIVQILVNKYLASGSGFENVVEELGELIFSNDRLMFLESYCRFKDCIQVFWI